MSDLISFQDSQALIRQNAPQQVTEQCDLNDCLGRRLAKPVIAKVSRPPAAVSAMDGYAVRLEDVTQEGAALELIGEAPAGTPFEQTAKPGETVRIFTGGELPPGTNHVVPQELTTPNGALISINKAYSQAAHVRALGVDFMQGATLIPAGTRLGPAELAIAAAANHRQLEVFRPLKVALLSNGNELKPPGSELSPGEIISSNPFALGGLLSQWGAEVVNLGIAADSVASIQSHISNAHDADIIVPIGGASVGDHDHMRTAFFDLGYRALFEKVAVKPGKPTWFAQKGNQYVLGLPGNPASALVCTYLFLPPLLDHDYRHDFKKAILSKDMRANGSRAHFLRAEALLDTNGHVRVTPANNQDSSLLKPFLSANCLIHRAPNDGALNAGELADILLIGPL